MKIKAILTIGLQLIFSIMSAGCVNPGNNANNMLSLASAFQQQGMSAGMIQQFIPVIVNYVRSSAGSGLANNLSAALVGQ